MNELCGVKGVPSSITCTLLKGHHGRHACFGHCDYTWENEAETNPCVRTMVAVLGVVGEPVRLRCGLMDAHDGPHRYAVSWLDGEDPIPQEPAE